MGAAAVAATRDLIFNVVYQVTSVLARCIPARPAVSPVALLIVCDDGHYIFIEIIKPL
jgi:hypothetical protein